MITVKIIVHIILPSGKTRHPSPLCAMAYTCIIDSQISMTSREFIDNRRRLYRAALVCICDIYHVCEKCMI